MELVTNFWYPVRDLLAWAIVVIQFGAVILAIYYRSLTARLWIVALGLSILVLVNVMNRYTSHYLMGRQNLELRDQLYSVTVVASLLGWGIFLVGLTLVLIRFRRYLPRSVYPNESWEL